jgi:PhzF family phenazine biosynthesis protein
MPTLHLLRVFCSENGSGGNPLGVFLDGGEVAPERRQAVAADLGLSEVVFVDDAESGEIRTFTPAVELDFAGHPSVGTAWMLDGLDSLQTQAGELPVRARSSTWGPGQNGDRRTT